MGLISMCRTWLGIKDDYRTLIELDELGFDIQDTDKDREDGN